MRVILSQNRELNFQIKDTVLICNLKITLDGFYLNGKIFFPSQIPAWQRLEAVKVENPSLITHTYLCLSVCLSKTCPYLSIYRFIDQLVDVSICLSVDLF